MKKNIIYLMLIGFVLWGNWQCISANDKTPFGNVLDAINPLQKPADDKGTETKADDKDEKKSDSSIIDLFENPEKKEKAVKAIEILKGAGNILASSTDLDYDTEFAIGESLAMEGFARYGLPISDEDLQRYVNMVGNAVAVNSLRSDIPYYFVIVNSPVYNAFACPGGIIFISSALLESMEDESELAGVLAHEVAHVAHKHALQTIKRAKFFEGVGQISAVTMKSKDGEKFQSMIGDLQNVLFDQGLDKNMEFEADLSGMEAAYRTGYDPNGLIRVLKMLQNKEKTAEKKGSWFSTHPPLSSRIEKCSEQMKAYPDASQLSINKDRFINYKQRISKSS